MKKTLLLCMMLSISLWAHAQATDIVVDCQTPGWLSSKINYGDQQTVKNLKVTGYVNDADLSFIGSLASNQQLDGIIDLGDVCVVTNGSTPDNYFDGTKILGLFYNHTKALSLVKFVCPRGATTAINAGAGFDYIDTLVYDCAIPEIGQEYVAIDRRINHLVIGERTIRIADNAFHYDLLNSIHFPSSLQVIGDEALMGVLADLSKTNINIFPSLEEIGKLAFINDNNTLPLVPSNKETLPDTIKLPRIINFNITAFDYKENIHIFLGDSLKRIYYKPDIRNNNIYWEPNLNNVYFHIRTATPPFFSFEMLGLYRLIPNGLTLCIPKGSRDAYENILNKYSSAVPHYYTLIEEDIPLEQIILNPTELTMEIGDITTIDATLLPESATESTLVWSVDDNSIASVSQSGEVTALLPGETVVYASSEDGKIQNTCKITVNAHAESVSIEPTTVTLSEIGDVAQLTATVLPANAVDKTVTWKSSNEAICSVTNQGLVTAVGAGTGSVTATTVDGNIMAYCIVKVTLTDYATIAMGSSRIATYSNNRDLNFTGVSGLKAYIGSGYNPATGDLTMTRVYKVPAGEGLLVKGAAGSYDVPYEETSAYYANLLVGVPTATTVSPTVGDYTNFILSNDEVKGIGFYPLASAGEIGANKAYLQLPTSILPAASRSLRMVFEDEEEEATGISSMKAEVESKPVFDLQGRRVMKPTRGLYIKDGKKIMVK